MTERTNPPQMKSPNQARQNQPNADAGPGQAQQFDAHSGRQPSAGGAHGSLADRIREHSPVLDANGNQVGLVDHVRDGRIQLTRDASGEHHYIPLDLVIGVDSSGVRLRERGDNDFGVEAGT